MINKILPLLDRLLPSNLAKKALEKKIPQLNNYFASAAGAGYSLDSTLDFLRDQFEPIEDESLRADEKAAIKRTQQSKFVGGLGKAALGAGLGGIGIAAVPTVIGSLFQEKKPANAQEAMQMNIAKAKKRRQPSELSRESLMEQRGLSPEEPQPNSGKAALLQTMQEITEALRRMRGNG